MHTLKPIDEDIVIKLAEKVRVFITVEEHVLSGRLGSAIGEIIIDKLPEKMPILKSLGIPDAFPSRYGSQESMLENFRLQPAQIVECVRDMVLKYART